MVFKYILGYQPVYNVSVDTRDATTSVRFHEHRFRIIDLYKLDDLAYTNYCLIYVDIWHLHDRASTLASLLYKAEKSSVCLSV